MISKLRSMGRRLKRKLLPPVRPGGKVRLHLGCGADYWQGLVNVDVSPDSVCDLNMDFTGIGDLYPDGSVTEVVMIHSLSYLRLWQARDLFGDLYRLLEPGGRLIIELPDLAKCARKVRDSEGDLTNYAEAVRGLYGFGMDQIKNRDMFTPYAFGWASWHLKQELERVGFHEVTVCEPQTHGPRPWRDTRIEAVK